jgi:hypothetical protein
MLLVNPAKDLFSLVNGSLMHLGYILFEVCKWSYGMGNGERLSILEGYMPHGGK